MLRHSSGVVLHRQRLETPDGDFLDVDVADVRGVSLDPSAPVVLMLHGLEGCTQSGYALEIFRALSAEGLRPVGLNFRSCSGEINRLPRFYHSGDTADLAFVLNWLVQKFPTSARGAVGFSLGGNVLLKFLGERGVQAREHLSAAVAISVPFDLGASARQFERGLGRAYTEFFMRKLRKKVRDKAHQVRGRCDYDRAASATTFYEFDDAATAPLHGFRDADDYYKRSSSARYIGGVRVPTLVVHAEDDPFLPTSAIPRTALARNPVMHVAITSHGGHVGFVAGAVPWSCSFWAECRAARFLAARLHEAGAASSLAASAREA